MVKTEDPAPIVPGPEGDAPAIVPENNGTKKDSTEEAKVTETVPEVKEEPKKMRAVTLTSFGGLKGVKMAERIVPSNPKEDQVTVKVNISGISFQDLMMRLGVIESAPKTPFILGTELIGTVTAVGSNVTTLKEGDLVFALPENGGAWAELINVDASLVWKVTEPNLPPETFASTLSYLMAQLLLERVALQEGATIVVHSAGGAVGLAIRDLASLRNIHVIGIATAAKHEKLEGFKHLISRGPDYVAQIKKLADTTIDAVFDGQGGEDCAKGLSLLAPWGTYMLYGCANIVTGETKSFFSLAKSWWTQVEKVSPMKLYDENKVVGGFHLRQLIKTAPERVTKALETVWSLMAQGKVKPVHDLTFHFEQVVQGMQRMHERKNIGKVLIIPEPAPVQESPVKSPGVKGAKSESVDSNNGDHSESSPPATGGEPAVTAT